jgi:hypothetical protein
MVKQKRVQDVEENRVEKEDVQRKSVENQKNRVEKEDVQRKSVEDADSALFPVLFFK